MKLLVAAVDLDPAGWSWCVPGELVSVDAAGCELAGTDVHDPEHDCMFAFVGLVSGKATTLAEVRDLDMTREQLLEVIRSDFAEVGMDLTDEQANGEADQMLEDAEEWPPGTLVRRYADDLMPA
jgi:hypothetical protein